MKSIIAPKDFEVRATPICSLAKHLKSYYSLGINKHVSDHINRTVDLDTCPAHVYLTSENYGELKRDYELLERIEVECFDMLFTEESAKPEDMPKDLMSIEDVIKSIDPIGGVLVFSNEKKTIEGVTCVGEDEIGSEMAGYEYGFFDLNYRENEDYEAVIDLFFELANKVRKGGYIVVPKRSYWHLPHRIKAVEALSEVGGFYVEPPTLDNEEVIIIRKN